MKKSKIVLSFLLVFVMLFATMSSVAASGVRRIDSSEAPAVETTILTEENAIDFTEVELQDGEHALTSFSLARQGEVAFIVSAEIMAGVDDLGGFFQYLIANYDVHYSSTPTPTDDVLELFNFRCPPHPLEESYVLRFLGGQPFAVPVWVCMICGAMWYR